jgi:hypothetical protein
MRFLSLLCSIVCLLGIVVPELEAGVLIVSDYESAPEHKGVSTSKAYVDRDRMRVEIGDRDADRVFIFRQDQERFWLIDNKNKTYTEITKQDLHKMKQQLDGAMALMQEKMKNLPPEQRKMMEQITKGKIPAALPEAPKMVYKKVASGEKINRWICDKYEGHATEKDKEEIWTTDWQQAGITEADLKVIQGMGEFFAEFAKNLPFLSKIGSKEWEKEHGYSGFPIQTIRYAGTQVQYKMTIKDIRRQDFTAALFDLPSGLQKKATPATP